MNQTVPQNAGQTSMTREEIFQALTRINSLRR